MTRKVVSIRKKEIQKIRSIYFRIFQIRKDQVAQTLQINLSKGDFGGSPSVIITLFNIFYVDYRIQLAYQLLIG